MKYRNFAAASVMALAYAAPALAQMDDTAFQDVIVVTGSRATSETDICVSPDLGSGSGPDAASLIKRIPGGGLVDNGALSGQVQYRGMFGHRINVRVDGQAFASGGPNLMDPPLHYAPPALVDRLVVDRGVSPVRNGPGIGGGVDAVFKSIDYTENSTWSSGYDLTVAGRTADSSYAAGGIAGASNSSFRVHGLLSLESGDDMSFGDGNIRTSEHERQVYGLGAGAKLGAHELSLDLRRQETGDTGNPPFPMDIRYFDTDFARIGYKGNLDVVDISARVSWSDVSHAMTNYHLRPAPADMTRYRETFAYAETVTASLDASFDLAGGEFTVGADHETADHDVRITNPNNANFFVRSMPDAEAVRTGVFMEWAGPLGGHNVELGARADGHDLSVGQTELGSALPMGPRMLAMAFNMSDRSWDATTTDFVARVWRETAGGAVVRMNFARKQRAPSYLEALSWLPTQASGGLADGNIYIGNADLDAETAWIAEAGVDWVKERFHMRPTLWYRSIDDFIQGTPFEPSMSTVGPQIMMVSTMNGDASPLIWSNVDARIWGFDVDAGVQLTDTIRLDGALTWLTGERRDIDDYLYRMTPPHASVALTYEKTAWSASLETVAYAEQSDVSATNSEAETPGYLLVNLVADWQLNDQVHLSFGVDNVLDHVWRDHMGGYNRIMDSDVGVGQRLPGPGRNVFARLRLAG